MMPSEWQPVETAPKDGTPFLAWCPIVAGLGDTDATPDAEMRVLWWESRGQFPSDRDLGDEPFTHWMPLPERPERDEDFMTLSQVAREICMTESEILDMVKAGELPRPVKRNGKDMWKWAHVDKAVEGEIARPAGYVYFVEAGDFIKIGFSRDVISRLSGIATGSAIKPVLLHYVSTEVGSENGYHRQFHRLRTHGEWFRKGPELLELIAKLKVEHPVNVSPRRRNMSRSGAA